MKEMYEKPVIEVFETEDTDVIRTSPQYGGEEDPVP